MNRFRSLLSSLRQPRAAQGSKVLSEVSKKARNRFRHSILGEPGIDEAVRLFGVGR